MIEIKRRNLSSMARRYARAQGIVVSIPKSGRTWVRVFLHAYCCAIEEREFTLGGEDVAGRNTPQFIFTHDLWEHLTIARFKDWLRGRHLVPRRECLRKPIVLMARDPRDVMVSLFFQLTKRDRLYQGTLSEMLRDAKFGIAMIVEIMNTWMADWGSRNNVKLVRYEDCRVDPTNTFRDILRFLDLREIDEAVLRDSLKFSSFENMRRLEEQGGFVDKILVPGNRADADSFKVRRGIVGGYHQYLTRDDLEYIAGHLASLDSRYGYFREPAPALTLER